MVSWSLVVGAALGLVAGATLGLLHLEASFAIAHRSRDSAADQVARVWVFPELLVELPPLSELPTYFLNIFLILSKLSSAIVRGTIEALPAGLSPPSVFEQRLG
jgi:hypothetical protein